MVALHRAVAVAEVDGPAAALALVDEPGPGQLLPVPRDPRPPAAAARPGREAAAAAYQAALDRAGNAAERDFLRGRLRDVSRLTACRAAFSRTDRDTLIGGPALPNIPSSTVVQPRQAGWVTK